MAWALRDTMDTKAQGSDNRPLIVALAIIPILLLSMLVTGFLAVHYPLPDDNATALGLLGSVFVALYALFLLVFVVGAKVREGQYAAAVKGGLLLIGLGLLIGPLPWLIAWLVKAYPWFPFLLRVLFAVWASAALVLSWRRPRKANSLDPYFPAVLAYLILVQDSRFPPLVHLLGDAVLIASVIWRVVSKRRRARASAVGSSS